MHEVDARARRAAARLGVEQALALGPERVRGRLDVDHAVGHLLDARPVAVEELADRRVRAAAGRAAGSRSCRPAAVARRQHGFAHPLLLVDLGVRGLEAEGFAVPGDRLVEVGDRDADVVDRRRFCALP